MARLVLATLEGLQFVELSPSNTLGRHPGNSIQLLDKIVSKEHCSLEKRQDKFVLRDLGSLNGTFVNGTKVASEQTLEHGDEILLGGTRFRFDDGRGNVAADLKPSTGMVSFQTSKLSFLAHAAHAAHAASNPKEDSAAPKFVTSPMAVRDREPYQELQSEALLSKRHGLPSQVKNHFFQQAKFQPEGKAEAEKNSAPSVDMLEGSRAARAIGAQIKAAGKKGFLPFDQARLDPEQLRLDYERLRITMELSREIGLERDTDTLLEKLLKTFFRLVKADRGVIHLAAGDGSLKPASALRRDGTKAPIEVSSTILSHVVQEKASVLSHDAPQDFAVSAGKSVILNRISSAIVVPLLHEDEVLGTVWLDSPSLAQFQEKDLEAITTVANQAAMFIKNTLLAEKIEHEIVNRERFSRLLSPNVVARVLSGALDIKKGGTRVVDCTVFNSDIRGFTAMSEDSSAEVMVELLNEYFELMVETIFKYDGTLDKFMGDGIMAFWGAPVEAEHGPIRCVQCALDQMNALSKFNRRRMEQNQEALAVGMGIHTGPLVAGYVGSSKALSYTVIGDTVNISSRLCSVAGPGQILVSESTLFALRGQFHYEELSPVVLKGKEKPLRIFNILFEKKLGRKVVYART